MQAWDSRNFGQILESGVIPGLVGWHHTSLTHPHHQNYPLPPVPVEHLLQAQYTQSDRGSFTPRSPTPSPIYVASKMVSETVGCCVYVPFASQHLLNSIKSHFACLYMPSRASTAVFHCTSHQQWHGTIVSDWVMVSNSGGVAANKVCGGKWIRILGGLCGRQWLIVFSV